MLISNGSELEREVHVQVWSVDGSEDWRLRDTRQKATIESMIIELLHYNALYSERIGSTEQKRVLN